MVLSTEHVSFHLIPNMGYLRFDDLYVMISSINIHKPVEKLINHGELAPKSVDPLVLDPPALQLPLAGAAPHHEIRVLHAC